MQPAELLAELFDFGFGEVLLVLGFDQLFGDIFQVSQNAFEHLAQALHFGANVVQNGARAFGPGLRFAHGFGSLVARVRRGLAAPVLLVTAPAMMRAGKARAMIAPPAAILAAFALRHAASAASSAASAPAPVAIWMPLAARRASRLLIGRGSALLAVAGLASFGIESGRFGRVVSILLARLFFAGVIFAPLFRFSVGGCFGLRRNCFWLGVVPPVVFHGRNLPIPFGTVNK